MNNIIIIIMFCIVSFFLLLSIYKDEKRLTMYEDIYELRTSMQKLSDLYLSGHITIEEYNNGIEEINSTIEEIERELNIND